jgi:hypothetical protein
MNSLARILSHGFAIIVVVILAAGYIYRGELFPDTKLPGFLAFDTHSETVEKEVPAAEKAVPAPRGERSSDVHTPAMPAEESAAVPEESAVEESEAVAVVEGTVRQESKVAPVVEETIAQEDVETAVTAETADAPQAEAAPEEAEVATAAPETWSTGAGEAGTAASVSEPPMQSEAATETAPEAPLHPAESAPVTTAMTTGDEHVAAGAGTSQTAHDETPEIPEENAQPQADVGGPVADEPALSAPPDTTKSYQLLAAAREAYWMHDYAEAEANYLRLAALEPENPDSYGELGNMYFTRGKWEQAAAAYFEAGKRLVESGHIEEARTLVDVIRGLNGTQADRLEKLVRAATSSE